MSIVISKSYPPMVVAGQSAMAADLAGIVSVLWLDWR